jgi:ribosomal 50S subunit-associated protein YjgA (DUF615 family)
VHGDQVRRVYLGRLGRQLLALGRGRLQQILDLDATSAPAAIAEARRITFTSASRRRFLGSMFISRCRASA